MKKSPILKVKKAQKRVICTDIMIYGDNSSDIALTDHERKHLEIYRLLDDKGQHTVDTVTQMEYERVKKDNK